MNTCGFTQRNVLRKCDRYFLKFSKHDKHLKKLANCDKHLFKILDNHLLKLQMGFAFT